MQDTFTWDKMNKAIEKTQKTFNKYSNFLSGFQLIENINLINTFTKQKRKHKKKRINKKWAKIYGYYTYGVPMSDVYYMGNKIIGHPDTLKRLVKSMDKMQ